MMMKLSRRSLSLVIVACALAAPLIAPGAAHAIDRQITVTGDFDSWARAEAITNMASADGDAGVNRSFSTAIETRRLGECDAGQIPGDVILPGGKTIHVNPSARH